MSKKQELPPPPPKESDGHEEILEDLLRSLSDWKREIVETIVGSRNREVKPGNTIIQKARVISGNYNRMFILMQFLKDKGLDTDKYTVYFANNTVGFSPKLPDYGMRGEALDILNVQKPVKEVPMGAAPEQKQPQTETKT
jgi:hypothetical protein